MSFSLESRGGRFVDAAAWRAGCAALGVAINLRGEFLAGEVAVDLRVIAPTLCAAAPRFMAAGALRGGFDCSIADLGPDTPIALVTHRLAEARGELERLLARRTPEIFIETWREKIATLEALARGEAAGEQRIVFSTASPRSPADFLAQSIGAAAHAIAAGGALVDQSSDVWPRAESSAVREMLAHLLAVYLDGKPAGERPLVFAFEPDQALAERR